MSAPSDIIIVSSILQQLMSCSQRPVVLCTPSQLWQIQQQQAAHEARQTLLEAPLRNEEVHTVPDAAPPSSQQASAPLFVLLDLPTPPGTRQPSVGTESTDLPPTVPLGSAPHIPHSCDGVAVSNGASRATQRANRVAGRMGRRAGNRKKQESDNHDTNDDNRNNTTTATTSTAADTTEDDTGTARATTTGSASFTRSSSRCVSPVDGCSSFSSSSSDHSDSCFTSTPTAASLSCHSSSAAALGPLETYHTNQDMSWRSLDRKIRQRCLGAGLQCDRQPGRQLLHGRRVVHFNHKYATCKVFPFCSSATFDQPWVARPTSFEVEQLMDEWERYMTGGEAAAFDDVDRWQFRPTHMYRASQHKGEPVMGVKIKQVMPDIVQQFIIRWCQDQGYVQTLHGNPRTARLRSALDDMMTRGIRYYVFYVAMDGRDFPDCGVPVLFALTRADTGASARLPQLLDPSSENTAMQVIPFSQLAVLMYKLWRDSPGGSETQEKRVSAFLHQSYRCVPGHVFRDWLDYVRRLSEAGKEAVLETYQVEVHPSLKPVWMERVVVKDMHSSSHRNMVSESGYARGGFGGDGLTTTGGEYQNENPITASRQYLMTPICPTSRLALSPVPLQSVEVGFDSPAVRSLFLHHSTPSSVMSSATQFLHPISSPPPVVTTTASRMDPSPRCGSTAGLLLSGTSSGATGSPLLSFSSNTTPTGAYNQQAEHSSSIHQDTDTNHNDNSPQSAVWRASPSDTASATIPLHQQTASTRHGVGDSTKSTRLVIAVSTSQPSWRSLHHMSEPVPRRSGISSHGLSVYAVSQTGLRQLSTMQHKMSERRTPATSRASSPQPSSQRDNHAVCWMAEKSRRMEGGSRLRVRQDVRAESVGERVMTTRGGCKRAETPGNLHSVEFEENVRRGLQWQQVQGILF